MVPVHAGFDLVVLGKGSSAALSQETLLINISVHIYLSKHWYLITIDVSIVR